MLQDTKKSIRDVVSIRVKNILYYIFFELGGVGKHGRKNIGVHWKGPRKCLLRQRGCQKKIMNVKNINVLVLKIDYHIFE
jgi:hypothetical protein